MPKTVDIRLVCDDEETLLHIRERIVAALREQGDFNADIKKPRKGRGDDYLSYGTIFPTGTITREIKKDTNQ